MTAARFSSLDEWLSWQETLHPRTIDLGLERAARVAGRLGCVRPAPLVISVAGTNGKGSCVALLEAVLLAQGYRVGAYTSPHLFRYNERIRLDGNALDEAAICAAFARVDAARADDTLTYFEFGTLAALDIMTRAGIEVALLEVGLGGRLDAVNIVDADAALITTIGIDHVDWLGPDRDSIAREKAGILRPGRPAVCGDSEPPDSLLDCAVQCRTTLAVAGRDFSFTVAADGRSWQWQGRDSRLQALPLPALPGRHQLANAAAVLAVLESLATRLPVSAAATASGLRQAVVPGRVQRIGGAVEQVLDVSHNAQAAQALADSLAQNPPAGRCHALLGMMQDKDIAGFVRPLLDHVDVWYPSGLQTPRAATAGTLAEQVRRGGADCAAIVACSDVQGASTAIRARVRPGDRVLVCGSFYTVAEWSALQVNFD